MDTDGFRKAIHFDLDTATVESTFGKKNTSMAYRKIRKFLESNGFAHSQYSGYMSLRPMSDLEVYRTYDMMKEALPWLEPCAQKIHVLVVADEFDLLGFSHEENEDIESPARKTGSVRGKLLKEKSTKAKEASKRLDRKFDSGHDDIERCHTL